MMLIKQCGVFFDNDKLIATFDVFQVHASPHSTVYYTISVQQLQQLEGLETMYVGIIRAVYTPFLRNRLRV